MLKSEKGISLLTVIVTIIIMIIIIYITGNASLDSVEEANITKINNEIKNLKDAVSIRITNYERNQTSYPLIGEKIGDTIIEYLGKIPTLTSGEVTKISNSCNLSNKDYFRLVGSIEAKKLGVEGIDIEHYYIVNYYECEVYGPVDFKLVNGSGG